jgi:hypothetical protein
VLLLLLLLLLLLQKGNQNVRRNHIRRLPIGADSHKLLLRLLLLCGGSDCFLLLLSLVLLLLLLLLLLDCLLLLLLLLLLNRSGERCELLLLLLLELQLLLLKLRCELLQFRGLALLQRLHRLLVLGVDCPDKLLLLLRDLLVQRGTLLGGLRSQLLLQELVLRLVLAVYLCKLRTALFFRRGADRCGGLRLRLRLLLRDKHVNLLPVLVQHHRDLLHRRRSGCRSRGL